MPFNKPINRIAIVGTGLIGGSWAALYLAHGFDVVATDPAPGAEEKLRHYVDTAWEELSVLGLAPKASKNRLSFTPSSSGLTVSVMQSACKHPERCVIGHPFNPPHVIPLVEVVGGEKTSAEAIAQAISFYSSIGKKPIHLRKEVVGHVANRLQAALYREVVHLIEQGVLDVADSDTAVCWGPGLRWGVMGPNLLFHLGGGPDGIRHFMDHLSGPVASWWKDLGTITEFSPAVKQTIIEGALQEAGNRTIEQLEHERDEVLLGLLKLRNKQGKAFPVVKKVAKAK